MQRDEAHVKRILDYLVKNRAISLDQEIKQLVVPERRGLIIPEPRPLVHVIVDPRKGNWPNLWQFAVYERSDYELLSDTCTSLNGAMGSFRLLVGDNYKGNQFGRVCLQEAFQAGIAYSEPGSSLIADALSRKIFPTTSEFFERLRAKSLPY